MRASSLANNPLAVTRELDGRYDVVLEVRDNLGVIQTVAENIDSVNIVAENIDYMVEFNCKYFGSSTEYLTTKPNGDALEEGDLFFYQDLQVPLESRMKVYSNGDWYNSYTNLENYYTKAEATDNSIIYAIALS